MNTRWWWVLCMCSCGGNVVVDCPNGADALGGDGGATTRGDAGSGGGTGAPGPTTSSTGHGGTEPAPCAPEQGCNTSPDPPCGDARSLLCEDGAAPPGCTELGPACGRTRWCCPADG